MTGQTSKFPKPATAAFEPERLPAELYYMAADIMVLSPKAAALLRAAAGKIHDDLRVRSRETHRSSGAKDSRAVEHLRLVL